MGITTGILLFDDAEELDFVGPWEVLTSAAMLEPEDRVVTIAEKRARSAAPRACASSRPHASPTRRRLDVVLVPGGQGTRREVSNPALIDWLREGRRALPLRDERLHRDAAPPRGRLRARQARHHPLGLRRDAAQARRRHRARRRPLRARRQPDHRRRRLRRASTWRSTSSASSTRRSSPARCSATSSTTPPRPTRPRS